ncbi:MAG TPA: hypothetical protein VJ947_06795 [Pseudohaliea sp.]|nr:hypothetical protein [Pseudohaliea sp.]
MKRRALALAGLLMALAGALPAMAQSVRSPHYGEALFHFYQDDLFGALTRLMAADAQDRLGGNTGDAAVLQASLALAYGLRRDALQRFSNALSDDISPDLRHQAWLQLARIALRSDDLSVARAALRALSGPLPPRHDGERRLLSALVDMRLGRPNQAVDDLTQWRGPEALQPYARVNLGIALLRAGQTERALQVLNSLQLPERPSDDLLALQDRAALTAGFTLLGTGSPRRAMDHLARVRADGPFGGRALLGAGWALAEGGDLRSALGAWLALEERPVSDPSAQEARLAIPYAYDRLGAAGQAAAAYQATITDLEDELRRLDGQRALLAEGLLLEALSPRPGAAASADPLLGLADSGGLWLPPDLLASHPFQHAVRTYRELHGLRSHLQARRRHLAAFDQMLETRRARYGERLPATEQGLQSVDLETLRGRRDALASRLEAIAEGGDVLALASAEERAALERLDALGEALDQLPDAAERAGLAQRQRVLRGVLHWRLATDFASRLHQGRKSLQALDQALQELRASRDRLERARTLARDRFEGFESRIAGLRQRLEALLPRLEATLEAQGGRLTALAEATLGERHTAVRRRLAQARFALARLYDRATSPGTGG